MPTITKAPPVPTAPPVDARDELVQVMHEGRIKLVRRGDLIDPAFHRA